MLQSLLDRVRPHLLPALGLSLLTLAVYGQTLGFDFLSNWDDYQYITSNPDIRGFSAQNLVNLFSRSYVGNYAPLHLFSYLVDYQLVGLNAAWFHGVNLLLHLACGLLFYAVVQRLTSKPFWALASAAIFLLHPVQVESVAWVTERKTLLAMLFSLVSFLNYLSYRKLQGEQSHYAYFRCLLFLVFALLSKSIAVVVPILFLLHDLFLEDFEDRKGIFVDKIPLVLAAALCSGIALATQSAQMGGGMVDFFEGDLNAKLLTMLTVLTRYFGLLFWPTPASLNSVYILFVKTRIDAEVGVALVLVAALTATGVYLFRKERRLFFGFAVFFLGLIPVSQIVPLATLMNDRYLYFPMLGAAWIAGGLFSALNDRLPLRRVNAAHLLLACLMVPLLLFSYQRCGVWRNAVALWSDVARKYPALKDQRAALAAAYLYADRKDEALATYRELFTLKRDFSDPLAEQKALYEASRLYLEKGEPAQALPLLTSLTAKYPQNQYGLRMLAECRQRLKLP